MSATGRRGGPTTDLDRELRVALSAASAAGALLRDEFHRPGGARGFGDKADVDAVIERMLQGTLLEAFPEDGFQGEETAPRQPSERRYWCIDPNDGTTAFLRGDRGCAVSLGLIEDGEPVLGIVFAPLYPDDDGDLLAWARGGPLLRNGVPVERAPLPTTLDRHHVVTLARGAERAARPNLASVRPARFRPVPSLAYRIALVAAGEAEAAAGLHGCHAWDVAGAHALLRAVSGDLFLPDGTRVRYAPFPRVKRIFGSSAEIARTLSSRTWAWQMRHADPESAPELVFETPRRPTAGAAVRDPGRLSRAQGALLGLIAGDSLGQLVEFQSAASIAERYPRGVSDLADGGTWNLIAGQPTDDSELALLLARTIDHRGVPDPELSLESYRVWVRGAFDVGGTIGRALDGHPDPGSQANGSLMRIAPLGIFGHALSPERLAAHAREESALTHVHPVCGDACAVYCVAIAHAIATGASPRAVYEATLDFAVRTRVEPDVLASLRDAEHSAPPEFLRQQGWVRIALQNAFFRLLHASSAPAGVIETVNAGGDTDTNAAIAGALLFAVHGREALPAMWRRLVLTCRPIEELAPTKHPRPRAFWPVDALVLAERLLVAGYRAAGS